MNLYGAERCCEARVAASPDEAAILGIPFRFFDDDGVGVDESLAFGVERERAQTYPARATRAAPTSPKSERPWKLERDLRGASFARTKHTHTYCQHGSQVRGFDRVRRTGRHDGEASPALLGSFAGTRAERAATRKVCLGGANRVLFDVFCCEEEGEEEVGLVSKQCWRASLRRRRRRAPTS